MECQQLISSPEVDLKHLSVLPKCKVQAVSRQSLCFWLTLNNWDIFQQRVSFLLESMSCTPSGVCSLQFATSPPFPTTSHASYLATPRFPKTSFAHKHIDLWRLLWPAQRQTTYFLALGHRHASATTTYCLRGLCKMASRSFINL